jgi:hypothetical protein
MPVPQLQYAYRRASQATSQAQPKTTHRAYVLESIEVCEQQNFTLNRDDFMVTT